MQRLLNYFVNGKGIGLLGVLGLALLLWGVSGFLFNGMIKSFLNQPETMTFLEQMPTLEIKDGHIAAPLVPEQRYSFPLGGGEPLILVVNTLTTDKPTLDFEQGVYVTANAVYLKTTGAEQTMKLDHTLTQTVTPEKFKSMLLNMSGLAAVIVGFFPFLIVIVGFIIVYLIVLAFGVLFNGDLTFAAWGRIASAAWMMTAAGFSAVFAFTLRLNTLYVIAFAIVLSLIFALKCRGVKKLSGE